MNKLCNDRITVIDNGMISSDLDALERIEKIINPLPIIDGKMTYMNTDKGFFFDLNLEEEIRVVFSKYMDKDENVYFNLWFKGELIMQNTLPFRDFIQSFKDFYEEQTYRYYRKDIGRYKKEYLKVYNTIPSSSPDCFRRSKLIAYDIASINRWRLGPKKCDVSYAERTMTDEKTMGLMLKYQCVEITQEEYKSAVKTIKELINKIKEAYDSLARNEFKEI